MTVLVPVLVLVVVLLLLLPRKATYESPAPPAVLPSVSIAVWCTYGRCSSDTLAGRSQEIITKPFGDPQSQSPDNLLASPERERLSLSDAGKFAESFR